MSTSLPILLVAAHMVGDYIFQTNWMAARKMKNWWVLTLHVWLYVLAFVPVLMLTGLSGWDRLAFLCWLGAAHYLTDFRRWASPDPWPPKPILVDQTIHLVTIGVLAALFGL